MRILGLLLIMISGLLLWSSAVLSFAASFADNGNGTVTDNRTGLLWQQGEPGYMKWQNALNYCNGLTLVSYSDWRLPNIKELESLVDDGRYDPAIDTTYFPNANASSYWSSTTYAVYPSHAWYVYFANGYVFNYYKGDDYYYVRCVRGGQSCSFGNLARRISGAVVTDYSSIQDAYDAESNAHILRTMESVYCEPPIYLTITSRFFSKVVIIRSLHRKQGIQFSMVLLPSVPGRLHLRMS
jgi:hypothetical protein